MSKQSDGTRPDRTERNFRTTMAVVLSVVCLALVWYGKERVLPPAPRTLVVYAFSTMEETLRDGVFPAFQRHWLSEAGERVELVATFAGSGTLTDKIVRRLPAEVAVLSSPLDAARLLRSGALASSDWRELPQGGVLTRSPIVVVVREGNLKGIGEFADLAKSGTSVLHTDPATSGAAQWSILAEYGSAFYCTGDRDRAAEQLLDVWKNVAARAASARAARTDFESGVGDAFVTYEQDAIGNASRPSVAGEIVYPKSTIVSEHTACRLARNVSERQRPLVDAFLEFLWSREAQQIFVDYGFRSPIEELNRANPRFVELEEPFTLDDLGGAKEAEREILHAVWRDRVLPQLD